MTIAKKLMTTGGAEAVYVDDAFSTYLYGGTGSAQTITNGIDLDGEGGLVWIKQRNNPNNHLLIDTERGATETIFSNSNSQEVTYPTGLTSFNSDGFTLGAEEAHNSSGIDYASWSFRKQEGFFDVVTWTGDGTSDRAIPHNLGSEVGCILLKQTDASTDWTVYHREMQSNDPANYRMQLNTNLQRIVANSDWGSGTGTIPTDSEFTVHANTNLNGATYVAYLFAHDAQMFGPDSDESIIKCGSYRGNGSVDASVQEIDLGYEPQWVMIKKVNSTGHWVMLDTMRHFTAGANGNQANANYLRAN